MENKSIYLRLLEQQKRAKPAIGESIYAFKFEVL